MIILDRLRSALGPPQNLRELVVGDRVQGAVGRWRHQGASLDLSGLDTVQLVFNVSGGQIVELRIGDQIVSSAIRAGSIGLVSPGAPISVKIAGEADTVQIVLSRELLEDAAGLADPAELPPVSYRQSRLQAVAARTMVFLAQRENSGTAEMVSLVRETARLVSSPEPIQQGPLKGGLSPAAQRRVHSVLESDLRAALGELASAAGLSIHHFVKAFQKSEGQTPHALLLTRRIDEALSLLLQGGARVDEISDETGFSSPAHFVSTFRKRVGVTPGALRAAATAGF